MPAVLANQNVKLSFAAAWVLGTDYKTQGLGADEAQVLLASANAMTDIQTLVQADGAQLGATGSNTITDTSLAQIGGSFSIPGAATYAGSLSWYYKDDTTGNPFDTYRRGVSGFLFRRIGPAATTNYANNDRGQLYQVTFDVQQIQMPAGGGYFTYVQPIAVTNAWEHATVKTALS